MENGKEFLTLYPIRYNVMFIIEKTPEFDNMKTSKFDIAEYLDSKEMITQYLNTVLEEGNDEDVIIAIGHIAKAIGMTKISEKTGLSRASLYKALSDGAKPRFATIMKVLKAIGGHIQINPIST